MQQQRLLYSLLFYIAPFLIIFAIIFIVLVYFMYTRRNKYTYKPGMKAGLLTYFLLFVFGLICTFLISPLTFDSSDVLGRILGMILGGLFWGSVYVYFYERIPGSSSIKKSFSMGFIIILIPAIITFISISALLPLLMESTSNDSGYSSLVSLICGIVEYVIYGIFMGYFYDKFKKPQQQIKPL